MWLGLGGTADTTSGVRPTGDDRRKARTVGVLEQVHLDHSRDLALGEAGLSAAQHVGQTAIEHVDGCLQAGQLLSVFDDAQVVDEPIHRS